MTRVILIEDDSDLRAAMADTLRAAGFDVAAAADGTQGLELHRRSPADLIITDLFMPGQEGFETIDLLRRMRPRPRVVAISGGVATRGTYDFLPAAKHIGADLCLRKPFSAKELVATVHRLLA